MDTKKFYNVNEKLSHLNEEQIEELIEKYYNGSNVKGLISEYNISTKSTSINSLFPYLINRDLPCPYCKVNMISKYLPKSHTHKKGEPFCPICNHNNGQNCNCPKCSLEREKKLQEEIIKKQKLVKEVYDESKYVPVNFEEFTFEEKVYTGALLRCAMTEDYSEIKGYDILEKKLSPNTKLTDEVIKNLIKQNIIKVSSLSPISAFEDCDKFPYTFYKYHVYYHLNLYSIIERNQLIEHLINPEGYLEENPEKCYELWKKIALNECLEYLLYNMEEIGFDYNIGDKTISVFSDLLKYFSTAQIFNIIYFGINQASRYFLEYHVSKKKAANSVIGHCQRRGERSIIKYNVL